MSDTPIPPWDAYPEEPLSITDYDAPVWNAAIEACVRDLRGLIRPVLSAAEMDARSERLAQAIRKLDVRAGAIDELRAAWKALDFRHGAARGWDRMDAAVSALTETESA